MRGVSLDVGAGEIVAVLGRNGMGKTTLIRSIMGLTPPQIRSGSITWRGENLIGLRPHDIAARKIAIVPQGRRLFPSLTVTEHLTMLKSARSRTGWTVDRVFGIFPRLAERRHHRGGQLSGGERGMLAVGRALMIDPQLILMDEPSEGLAPVMVQHLEEIVLDLKREGLSILLGRAKPLQRAGCCRPGLYSGDRPGRASGRRRDAGAADRSVVSAAGRAVRRLFGSLARAGRSHHLTCEGIDHVGFYPGLTGRRALIASY